MLFLHLYAIMIHSREVDTMRKKLIAVLLCISICLLQIPTIHATGDELPADDQYHVVNVDKDGSYEVIKSTPSYAEAKVAHTLARTKYNNLGITYGNSFVSIEQGVVSFDSSDCTVNTNYTLADRDAAGYLNGCYGNDAAFLEYNPATNKIKFKISGVTAWVDAAIVTVYPIETIPNVSSFSIKNDVLYHHIKSSATMSSYATSLALSKSPSYLKEDVTYYSYDSHYFYTSFTDMIRDYRESSTTLALNAKEPYYNYYQYMDHRSTSSYTPEDFMTYFKDTLALNQTMTAFYDKDNYIHDILTQSLLFQSSDAFFQYQNQFGANALMMLSLSINESAMGRSYLAFTRNNLFGHAAYDSAVEENASRYASIPASIYSHALHYISNSYLNPNEFQFNGGFFGNKAGGMNVAYASDPYWGEKAAQYYYEIDEAMGHKDQDQYALGISTGKQVPVYKKAGNKSDVLYAIKEGYDGSFILLEKIKNKDGTWYRVQSDEALNKEQELQEDGTYNFKNSYGYVKASDLSTILNAKRIEAKNYINITFDAAGGTFYPESPSITLQVENGKLPVITPPTKDHALFNGWDIKLKEATNNLTYKATYKKVKEIQLSEKPRTSYGVADDLDVTDGAIRVEFSDGSNKEVSLTTDMVSGFSSEKEGKQTLTITYAGTSVSYEISISSSKEDEKAELLERAAYIIKTYGGKVGLQDEAIEEIERFRDDLASLPTNILTRDQIRVIDRIMQENLSPRYSVVLDDNQHDLQISGLTLALQGEKGFLNYIMPKTLHINVSDRISGEDADLAVKVAKANAMNVESMLHITGTDDFSSLKLKQDIVYSIKKPAKDNEYKMYRVYFIEGDNVYQLPTTQSESRILFTNDKLGSYVVVSQNINAITKTQDFSEVNTIKGNGKNYVIRYIVIPIATLILLGVGIVAYRILRHRHPNGKKRFLRLKKKKKS